METKNQSRGIGCGAARCNPDLGKAEGITATAHKLARILYAMIKTKLPFDESLAFTNTPQKEARRLKHLIAQAK